MAHRRVSLSLVCLIALVGLSCGGSSSPAAPSRPLFIKNGSGNTVFDMPADVARVKITGTFTGNASNFIVWVHDDLIVNELLGTGFSSTTYSGTHAVKGGETRIEESNGVNWTFTEVR